MLTARYSRPIAAAFLAGVAAVASACSTATPSTGTSSAASTPAAANTSPSATSSTPSAEALAAYRAMWSDVAEASNTADYQAAYLPNHLAGQALLTVTDNMAVEKGRGIVAHGAPVLHPVVTTATATSVTVSDCTDGRAWLQVYASTDKPIDDIPGGFRATTATVSKEDGTWKVTEINSGADGTCHLQQ